MSSVDVQDVGDAELMPNLINKTFPSRRYSLPKVSCAIMTVRQTLGQGRAMSAYLGMILRLSFVAPILLFASSPTAWALGLVGWGYCQRPLTQFF
jgi:hypothetical protein